MEDSSDDLWSDTTGEKYLYRYRPANVFSIDEIMNDYLFFSSHKKLNDLNECRPFIVEGVQELSKEQKLELILRGAEHRNAKFISPGFKREFAIKGEAAWESVEKSFEDLLAYANQAVTSVIDTIEWGICCFSKKSLNPTMMAHYGGNAGFVICYDAVRIREMIPNATFLDVSYRDDPLAINLTGIAFGDGVNDREFVINTLTTQKSTDWAYEREVRIVSDLACDAPVSFEESLIRGVCVGPRASHSTCRVASRLSDLIGVKAYRAIAGEGYEFVVEPYKFDGFKEE